MRPTNDQNNGQPTTGQATIKPTNQHVTVADAALLLGISEDAVRSRLRRGTLRRETGKDGTVFVVLGTDRQPSNQRSYGIRLITIGNRISFPDSRAPEASS